MNSQKSMKLLNYRDLYLYMPGKLMNALGLSRRGLGDIKIAKNKYKRCPSFFLNLRFYHMIVEFFSNSFNIVLLQLCLIYCFDNQQITGGRCRTNTAPSDVCFISPFSNFWKSSSVTFDNLYRALKSNLP